jgi:catechol 2,3-dioxygenase-like lactoylglutathione lyase family enzyme
LTHPKDTFGPLEFARLNRETTIDPRVQRHWSASYWSEQHPLGIAGALRITMATRNPAAAARFYRAVLGATEAAPLPGHGNTALQVGSDTIVDLVDATDPALGDFGEGVFGMGFQVRDLDRAETFLRNTGLAVERRGGHTLVLAPAQALGTTVAFHQHEEVR